MAGHTYENAYKILHDVRQGVNEYSAGLWAGTETHGKYANSWLLTKINAAQSRMAALVMKTDVREFFYKSASISVASSSMTLPWDFGRIYQLEDANGYKVYPSTARITPVTGQEGIENLYYRSGKTLILNKSSVTATYTLKYFRQPKKMTYGSAAATSGLNALKMQAVDRTSGKNDYYNNLVVDNYTQALSATISDYVGSTRVATTDNSITWAENDVYGTVPDLPDELHHLVAPLAIMLVKAEHPASQEKPTQAELKAWGEMFLEALVAYANQPDDINMEDLFCDFGVGQIGAPINVPGQGYLIYG